MSAFFFYFFATILVLASLAVAFAKNPLYNVLSLVVAVFALSSLFLLLEAYFVGTILLMVYAGAVLVFFLFVVMCLNLQEVEAPLTKDRRFRFLGGLAMVAFLAECFYVIKSYFGQQVPGSSSVRGTIEAIGKLLFTDYLLPFELTSFLLLVAILGIVSLAQGVLKTGRNEVSL